MTTPQEFLLQAVQMLQSQTTTTASATLPVSAGLSRQQAILDERRGLFQPYSRPSSGRKCRSNDQPTNQLNQDSSLKFEQFTSEKWNMDTPVLLSPYQNYQFYTETRRSDSLKSFGTWNKKNFTAISRRW